MIEQYQDIIDNCNLYLDALEKIYIESNDTPQGRMISQLKWLRQEAEGERLQLPVKAEYIGTLRHVAVEHGVLMNNATPLWKVYHKRLLNLAKGRLIAKPQYNQKILPLVTYLLTYLPANEAVFRPKLLELQAQMINLHNTLPLKRELFQELGVLFYKSPELAQISNGIQTMEMISEYCFEGVRDLENSPYTMCQRRAVNKPSIAKF
ncbi:hypothetical protein DXX93_08550 [Thalassotalea euphylliae]|uniref:Uncharacterized protein n=1 Tax=Thalassotalea euphylliae TaxID=1655234 RepID=A0A3E0TQK6_9GAMM|nr:hypothetical protein [Thalassotalea euphylliae]REL26620.1 hypothetical protein DXX93_08550 [Thalassotalea euphylliae]